MKILCKKKLNTHGFTLIEIIIVLSLMVLVLVLSTVYYASSLPKFRLNAATREMIAEIRKARALSRIQNEDQTVLIHPHEGYFGLLKGKKHKIPDGIRVKIFHPLTGEIKKPAISIIFRTSGGSEGYYIGLSNQYRTQFIKIDPVVGAAVVQ